MTTKGAKRLSKDLSRSDPAFKETPKTSFGASGVH
jgi:hypothetical protein